MNSNQGTFAVKLARKSIESWVLKGEKFARSKCAKSFLAKSGAFVTLYTYPERDLRGCIGFPEPVMPLADAIIEAAICASNDPRFPSLDRSELGRTVVEVSVLTPPGKISVKNPGEYPGRIKIGRDGLIIKKGACSGLLLPQVPVEYGWDAETYLRHLCEKACLPEGAWKDRGAELFCFRSEIFGEKTPNGAVKKTAAKY
jgi:hypothetical protein